MAMFFKFLGMISGTHNECCFADAIMFKTFRMSKVPKQRSKGSRAIPRSGLENHRKSVSNF
jgi:hypothetical protein